MILARLKEETRDQHENLENVVNVMDSTFRLDDYRRLIIRFYSIYSAIEPKISASGITPSDIDLAGREKTSLLKKDLAYLFGGPEIIEKIERWRISEPIDTPAKAFGALYVLEGATLGGQIISRELKARLSVSEDSGGAFFNSYGNRVGPMWKAFGNAITRFAENCVADDEIVASARATFDSFRQCFSAPVSDELDQLIKTDSNITGTLIYQP
jgi:heme oxygenase